MGESGSVEGTIDQRMVWSSCRSGGEEGAQCTTIPAGLFYLISKKYSKKSKILSSEGTWMYSTEGAQHLCKQAASWLFGAPGMSLGYTIACFSVVFCRPVRC